MPSIRSLEAEFYYAHPRNAFWPILAAITARPIESQADKIALCQQQGILLWDVLQTCHRQGSLDSAIQQPVANDFESLFQRFPDLKFIFFNGKTAESLFKKQVLTSQNLPNTLVFNTLPSTSPANARLSFENKRDCWQASLAQIL